jgi:hypothetical protein
LIVPGKSIGEIKLGMRIADARKIAVKFGEIKDYSDNDFENTANGKGFSVSQALPSEGNNHYLAEGGTPGFVYLVVTDDSRFHLASGLKIGDDYAKFRTVFGQPDNAVSLYQSGLLIAVVVEWKNGLSVVVLLKDHSVVSIGVWDPAKIKK